MITEIRGFRQSGRADFIVELPAAARGSSPPSSQDYALLLVLAGLGVATAILVISQSPPGTYTPPSIYPWSSPSQLCKTCR